MPALAAPAVFDLDKLVDAALEAHRDELLAVIRQRVGAAVDEFVRDVLAAQLAGRSNGSELAPNVAARTSDSDPHTSSTKRCTGCKQTLPLEAFYRDERASDGRRSRCSSCVLRHDAARRREARAQETPPMATQNGDVPVPFAGSTSTISGDDDRAAVTSS